ncbi:putative glycolipid-binding domain-containing protein [Streptomyces sp. JJ36]|uniref:putative glycolipid-binding domain-containing protein n=1 Tax=Streptomyces sp. JJ36 TaxID=2736645 RepID=UPI001F41DCAC|nr:putative glycolipid-binding domain-containing protein [Streptomyces sp. JJ36]MCF6521845.1 putative glycolipid-binding domain-containing protein [Streptomyces sp. JJ36]
MNARRRVLTWRTTDRTGYETAWAEPSGPSSFRAHGRAFGLSPAPYWLTYELETGEHWATRRIRVSVEAESSVRNLELERGADGGWTADGEPLAGLAEALDCDLGRSPLTNAMPVLRHRLHRAPGEHDVVTAWIAVPELVVRASRQRYTHVSRAPGGAVVRFASGDFRSDLTLDREGFVVHYPRLAERVSVG